jgi:hypothetical protein
MAGLGEQINVIDEGGMLAGANQVKASRPLIRVLVINDNHCGLTFLFEL